MQKDVIHKEKNRLMLIVNLYQLTKNMEKSKEENKTNHDKI
jgi:hypothetical protein